jgi:iron only hydrogenase large subunit-like protein
LHHGDANILKARAGAIYEEDEGKDIRKSHENPYIRKLYDEYLHEPMSEKAHELLHTAYFSKRKKLFQV